MNAIEKARSLKNEENLVLLYSGMAPGTKSILAWGAKEQIVIASDPGLDLGERGNLGLDGLLRRFTPRNDERWFGYLGYGLRNELEKLPREKNSIIPLPDILLMNFENEVVFDRHYEEATPTKQSSLDRFATLAMTLQSNMTDEEYKQKVTVIIEKIRAGELYQANLTRKFYGEIKADPFELFCKLTEISPAPYSAYIKFGDTHIISASPEKFLSIENGVAETCPIKGTLSSASPAALLALSEKDRAENLMIVDLMRNDLAKTCKNVRVPKLFEITSYKAYHHMSSTILGDTKASPLEVALGCFPPGSMTGAPKISAMKLCSELEGIERGVYSGALGWISGDACDLSVVIRTLIIQGDKFEFQVGGGIVADSTPEKELEEIYVKAGPIMQILNLQKNSSFRKLAE